MLEADCRILKAVHRIRKALDLLIRKAIVFEA